MTRRLWPPRILAVVLLAPAIIATSACHSIHIDATVENRTGAPIQLLEVDYPSASFGADHLDAGAIYKHRFQIRGDGPLTVQYTAADGRQFQITGPSLSERQQGTLDIILLPNGKAEFHPQLSLQP